MKNTRIYLKPYGYLKSVGFLLIFVFLGKVGYAYVPLDTLVKNATCIFEGTVVSNKCFYGSDGNIYTANWVKITKIINGNVNCGTVEIVTVGGTIDSITEWATGALAMWPGGSGIFFCIPSQWPSIPATKENPVALCVYSDVQGVMPYGVTYGSNPNPYDDSALVFIKNDSVHFFTGHRVALDSFQDIFGHGYINCGPPEDDLLTQFGFYPNPVQDNIHFSIPGNTPAVISFYDMTGRLVFTLQPAIQATSELKLNGFQVETIQDLDISLFKPGTYTGTVVVAGTVYKFKLVKI